MNWKSGPNNHSIGQLTYHILFWDKQTLAKFKGQSPEKFSGNNDDTFNNFDSKKWQDTVRELDEVMAELEKVVETADDKQLAEWASTIAHIGTHNAYHVGQIVYIRKEQGSWDPARALSSCWKKSRSFAPLRMTAFAFRLRIQLRYICSTARRSSIVSRRRIRRAVLPSTRTSAGRRREL